LNESVQFRPAIDSNRPYLYLPPGTVDSIAEKLSLQYDAGTDHYMINDQTHQKLLKLQPQLTFQFGMSFGSADNVAITLPYSSLSLQLGTSLSTAANNSRYFPIRKMINPVQSVLGRAFLQNAYLIADYERRTFSVHQVRFSDFAPDVRKIAPGTTGNTLDTWEAESKDPLPSQPRRLPVAAVAGIIFGSIAFAILVVVILGFCWRRLRHAKAVAEIQGDDTKIAELDSKHSRSIEEADSRSIQIELCSEAAPREMPDSEGEFSGFFSHAELDQDAKKVTHELEASSADDGSKILVDQKFASRQQLTVDPSRQADPAPSSPILQTPVEFYGCPQPKIAPVISQSTSEGNGGSIPSLQLIPPSPVVANLDKEPK
jgi:hypothetical protein